MKIARTDKSWLGREAALLARLGRRWGPALLDAGRVPDGLPGLRSGAPFVATTWVPGEELGLTIEAEGVDRVRLALVVAHGVGRALDELHALGVRHGDVKLSNVLVTGSRPVRDHAADRGATLIDVGLASPITGEAAVGGTPRYLAPELRRGEAATPTADLYALGIVLAEVLDPAFARAADPAVQIATWVRDRADGIASWIAALLSIAPGGRPSASWVAERASRALGLVRDDDELLAARQARVRRAYLAVRGAHLRAGAAISTAIDGEPRQWLDEAVAMAERLAPGAPASGDVIEPLDALGTARWIVGLVGAAASAWPTPKGSESALAARWLSLAASGPPEAWTVDEVSGSFDARSDAGAERALASSFRDPSERWLALTRCLLSKRPAAAVLEVAEDALADDNVPVSFVIDLANALLRRGEVGRAFAALARVTSDAEEVALLRAEIGRRRLDIEGAEAAARLVADSSRAALTVRDQARALLARLAWDAGDFDRAERELGAARGAAAAEVRALIAYAHGEHEKGLAIVAVATRDADAPLVLARLEATRGMLFHARGQSRESAAAFGAAVDLATRAGAVVEEATYLTGLAAAAVDAGSVASALTASTRAALLWERLDRPGLAARALLGRAAAYALIGACHDADHAVAIARERARESGDVRAAAFARWALVETRVAGDRYALEQARTADRELAGAPLEDRVRSAARLLVWADGLGGSGAPVDVDGVDAGVSLMSPAVRWEWWGARALSILVDRSAVVRDGGRVLSEIVSLLDVAAPLASRGPALEGGARLASEMGEGDTARRIETARSAAAETLREGCPPEHRASLVSVAWARTARTGAAPLAMGRGQLDQLDAIVRSLASRERLRPLLEQTLDTMILWTGAERGLLLLCAPSGRLAVRVARNLARRDLQGEQLSLSMSLARRAMEERQAVCATDAYAQIGDLHASVHALRLRSVLAVPLMARGDVLGVVYLDDRVRRGAFGDAELAWVRLVASQAALAIADARAQALLRRAVRRAERAKTRLAAELGTREVELFAARAELAAQGEGTRFRYDAMAGRSEPMQAMLRIVDRVTQSEVPVLLAGESGTGKELVARAIHANGSRSKRPFVSENCASVPEALLESTLFGHMRGAFTGASSTRAGLFDVADGGTLFLDEIGEMPLSMQTKLLRALQDGEIRPVGSERVHRVDVRIIGATHRDLEAMVAAATFREDLFYRLNVVSIRVPPLRERPADVPLLVAHFVEKHANGKRSKITRAAMDRLVAFPWPGNVRQLENEIRRALVLADDTIDVADLSEEIARGGPSSARSGGTGLKARVATLEAQLVRDALGRTKGNQTRAAEALGLSRFGLQKMMRRLGIRPDVS